MNIAILCHAGTGGSGVVATELGLALAKLGHDIHFVGSQVPFRLNQAWHPSEPGGVYFHQVEVANYPLFEQPLTQLATASLLAEVIEEFNIDLVHAHYAIPHATIAIQARDMVNKSKVVTTLHGTDVTLVGLEPAFTRSTKYAIEKSDAVTVVSNYLAIHTQEMFSIDRPISVVHNWVDSERFQPKNDQNRLRFAKENEAILVHASNFRPVKRPLDVIEIFAKVAQKIPAKLLMIGDGPEKPRCLELARKLCPEKIHFLGSFPSIESVLCLADVFLLPSSQESFGLAALEAMACGVPVVASSAGGLPEVIGDTGFLCQVGDIDKMAENCLKILTDPQIKQEISIKSRQRAIEKFNPSLILPQYLSIYHSVLS